MPTRENFVEAIKTMARANYKENYGAATILAPNLLGRASIDTPHGKLDCYATKLAAAQIGVEPRGWFGFVLDGKQIEEGELEAMGLGGFQRRHEVADWARQRLITLPVQREPAYTARELHSAFVGWAREKSIIPTGIVTFVRILTNDGLVEFRRRANGKVAPWVNLRQPAAIPIDNRSN